MKGWDRKKKGDKELKEAAKVRSKQTDKELRRDKAVTDNSIKILILGED